ncbi:uncharacterized protein B0P05DRAFT_453941, partial [Gilbertella persicaria]|uniref:uncharacterized protein n=1 Tax=Gilbertella persicaria TaxID=101096 RepID=UPI00221E536E
LQLMVKKLNKCSFASRICVSTSSRASSPFPKRDLMPNNGIIFSLKNVNDNMQGLLVSLKPVDHGIFLSSIDFAGLTTRSSNLLRLIEDNHAIMRIEIKTFAINNEL